MIFSVVEKKTGLETICKIVVILSRSQCVKHGIDLYRYRYVQSCIHQTDIRVIVWKTQEKATSGTLLSRLCKPVAYTETTCVPDPLSRHFSKKIWYPTKWLQNVAMISKILFDLVWWQVWNIDSYHILTKGSLWWNISNNRLLSIGPSYQRTLVKYLVCQCTENRVVMTPLLSSPGVLQVVIMMIACGDHGDDKVGIVTIFDFRCYIRGLVNITITIAIHCHLLRFLESESLSC